MKNTPEHEAAFVEMRPMLLKLATIQLRNSGWAEDAVSETLLTAIEQAHRFDGRAKLRTWVIGILKHKIVDQLRRHGREVSIEERIETGQLGSLDDLYDERGALASTPRDWGGPEQTLSQRQFVDALQQCLSQMPENLARVFLMREWLGHDTDEICETLGITANHCHVLLFRARMRLREALDAHHPAMAVRAVPARAKAPAASPAAA